MTGQLAGTKKETQKNSPAETLFFSKAVQSYQFVKAAIYKDSILPFTVQMFLLVIYSLPLQDAPGTG